VTDALSTTFAALADPTRRAILARLAEGSATVKELSEPFDMSGPAISKHLRVLERAGLITQGRRAQWRPCQLEAAPLREVAEWTASYRRFWEASFDRLGDYLDELQGRAPKKVSGSPRKADAPEAKPAKSAARSPSKRARKAAKGAVRSASKRETEAANGAARSASRRETEPAKTAARSASTRQPEPVKGTARKLDERAPNAPSRTTRTRSR
jgi:DNA-binding transcriptional ArsR family regulator